MLTTIETNRLPVESFQFDLQRACGAFSVEPVKGQSLVKGIVQLEKRAGLEIAHVAKDLQTIRRTTQEIKRDQGENFFLIVQEEGRAIMTQRDTVRMMQPGDMILIDSAEPSEFSFFGNFGRQLSVHLPRKEMAERFGSKMTGGKFLSRSDYLTIAMNAVLAKVFQPQSSEEQNGHLREAMLGLLGAWLVEHRVVVNAREVNADTVGAQLLQNGLAYLDRLFRDGSITIQAMAHDLDVSPRQLQRAFAMIGTTPTDYLLQKRLEHVCQLLLSRRAGMQSERVSSIAYASGFNDLSYFNRQFRKHFLCSPSEYCRKC